MSTQVSNQVADTRSATGEAGSRLGVFYGVAAYGLWGVFPVYFKAVADVPALEVVAHRVMWSVPFLVPLVILRHGVGAALAALRSRVTLLTLCATTVLIAGNWLVFVLAVTRGQVMQASLGYFINPLFSVLLGFVFLRERLRPWQTFSVLLAAVGVAHLTLAGGQFPGYALFMATSFGLYGLLRKVVRVDALLGLAVETALLWPIAAAFLAYWMLAGDAAFGASGGRTSLLLFAAGPVTALPLVLFAAAARRLRLATVGFLQYIAPTGHFLLAVLAYGEPFDAAHRIAFACIWVALAIYSVDSARSRPARVNGTARPGME
jgi:chloramphenicol-sensitive protein RarD